MYSHKTGTCPKKLTNLKLYNNPDFPFATGQRSKLLDDWNLLFLFAFSSLVGLCGKLVTGVGTELSPFDCKLVL